MTWIGRARSLGLALMVAGAIPSAARAAEPDDCPATRPQAAPVCSVEGMLETINPPRVGDVFGNLNPAAFVGGANADLLPGQASLTLAGAVSAGGAACARHLSAHRIGGTRGVPGLDPGTAGLVGEMVGEELDIPIAQGGTRRAVFEIFSPNVIALQGGGLHGPLSLRHDGVGGWPRNAGSHLVIALTNAGPGDLKAGDTYQARAVRPDGEGDPDRLYSAWTGDIRWVPYGIPNTSRLAREQSPAMKRPAPSSSRSSPPASAVRRVSFPASNRWTGTRWSAN